MGIPHGIVELADLLVLVDADEEQVVIASLEGGTVFVLAVVEKFRRVVWHASTDSDNQNTKIRHKYVGLLILEAEPKWLLGRVGKGFHHKLILTNGYNIYPVSLRKIE